MPEFSEIRIATYLLTLSMSVALSLLLTPVVRRLAVRLDFVDKPGGRKKQTDAVALGGGLAVFGATFGAVLFAYLFADFCLPRVFFGSDSRMLAGLAVAATATLLLGLYDDAAIMRGRYKLLGQLIIAGVLVYLGYRIERFSLFGNEILLGWMVVPFSLFWLVGATNAINLLDGIDGLASSLGMVLCLTFAAINGWYGHFPEAIIMIALGGALFGFLRYNFAPATIYLGDAGSMVIGLVIGSIAVQTHFKTPAFVAMVIPLAVWAIPIFDSLAAIVRRRLTGRSVFDPDRGHLHHSLLTRGWSVRQATLFIALICATTCMSALLGVLWRNEWIVIGTVVAIIVFLVSTKTFGHIEFALLQDRMRQHGLTFRKDGTNHSMPSHGAVRLQGTHEWEQIWESLVESSEEYHLVRMRLTIHMPEVHEAFYGNWKVPKGSIARPEAIWKLRHPLLVGDTVVGKLELAGIAEDLTRTTSSQIMEVLDFLEPIEENIQSVLQRLLDAKPTAEQAASEQSDADSLDQASQASADLPEAAAPQG